MKVRQLVGRFAGQIVEMPYHVAQSCIAAGTAAPPNAAVTNVRGMPRIAATPETEIPTIEDIASDRMIAADQTVRKGRGRKVKMD